jgi:hypothetical protein
MTNSENCLSPGRIRLESIYTELASKAELDWDLSWSIPISELAFVNDASLVIAIQDLRFYLLKRLG